MVALILVGCRKLFLQKLLQNRQIPCSNRGDAAEPGKLLPMPWMQELDTSSHLKCSQVQNRSWLGALPIVHVPAAADGGWAWRLYLLKCKVFPVHFPFLISARENISGCCCPRQSHHLGGHDYQSWSILQMGEGEQLTQQPLCFLFAIEKPHTSCQRKRNTGYHPVAAWPLFSSP